MVHELRSVSPQRLARIMAVVSGALMAVISLLAMPMILQTPMPENAANPLPKAFFAVLLLLYPVFGALWGWICGQILARIYNFVARRMGGILIDLAPFQDGSNERPVA